MTAARRFRLYSLVLLAMPLSGWAQQIHQVAPGKTLVIQSLPDSHVLRAPSGAQVTVGQYKAAIARAKAGQAVPQVKIGMGQTLASAAKLPAGTMVVAPSGARVSSTTLAHIQRIKEQAASRKKEMVLPTAIKGAPVGTVGRDFDIKQALARKDSDTVTLGNRQYTVGQLKYIDSHLKAAGQGSLADRAAKAGSGRPGASQAKVVKVQRNADLATLLRMPDDTILESPGGKRITVATLKAYQQNPEMKALLARRGQAGAIDPKKPLIVPGGKN